MTQIVEVSEAPSGGGHSGSRGGYRRRSSYRRRSFRRRYGYRRRYGSRFRRMFRRVSPGFGALSRFVRAQIDPFTDAVNGCKIPDCNTYPSTPLRVEDVYPATSSDANGVIVYGVLPLLKNTFVNGTSASASTWTWSAAYGGGVDSKKAAAIDTQFELYRPVAHGLKINCSGAPTTVTGNVHVAVYAFSDFGATTWTMPTSIDMLTGCLYYNKWSLATLTQQSVTIVNKFLDCTSTKYIDPASTCVGNATNIQFQNIGWACILVVVEGAPANTKLLNLENVIHIEALTKADGIATSTPAAPYNVSELQTVSRLAGTTEAARSEAMEQSYLERVAEAIGEGVNSFASHVFGRYVVPGARAVGYYGSANLLNAAWRYGVPGVTNVRNRTAFRRSFGMPNYLVNT